MANEDKKDFNKMLNEKKSGMPKIVELDELGAKKWKGKTMVVAPAIDYDNCIKRVPSGKLVTTNEIRRAIAKQYGTEIACPLTAGIFTNICAWASFQRKENETPFWRVLKTDGELNVKFPGYPDLQRSLLEKEGHVVFEKKNKFYVQDLEKSLYNLEK